jgi:hypothetical protein
VSVAACRVTGSGVSGKVLSRVLLVAFESAFEAAACGLCFEAAGQAPCALSKSSRPPYPHTSTLYSTGAVLKWCPADNPMRGLLGTLKSRADPTPLKVYPVHVTGDGSIYTKLV